MAVLSTSKKKRSIWVRWVNLAMKLHPLPANIRTKMQVLQLKIILTTCIPIFVIEIFMRCLHACLKTSFTARARWRTRFKTAAICRSLTTICTEITNAVRLLQMSSMLAKKTFPSTTNFTSEPNKGEQNTHFSQLQKGLKKSITTSMCFTTFCAHKQCC